MASILHESAGGSQVWYMPAGAPGAVDQGLFANLHAYVQINPALAPIAERLQLKRLVPMAVDQAIVEIITPVVERSVTIACMTAQELIVKVCPSELVPKCATFDHS